MSESWRDRPERGSLGLKRLIIWIALHAGRGVCRVLLVPICAYFLVTASDPCEEGPTGDDSFGIPQDPNRRDCLP